MVAGKASPLGGMHTTGTNMKNIKSLGQNWLKSRPILEVISDLAAASPAPVCLEIGPGLGTLTSSLLKRFSKVIAVEVDPRLATNLPKSFPNKNLEVIHADILQLSLHALFSNEQSNGHRPNFVVAGNIPYYITSPIIKKLLTAEILPERIVLLVQKEVAEKVTEQKKPSPFSLFVQNLADVELGPVVSRTEFTPPPKVDSQVLVLIPRTPQIPSAISDAVFKLIKTGFSSPRKKLVTNLSAGLARSKDDLKNLLKSLGLDSDVRPSDLELSDWTRLYQKLQK